MELASHAQIVLRQRKELAELVGFETRNKFEILAPDGSSLGFAAEQGKGIGAAVARMVMGHWRTFEVHVFDASRRLVLVALHPWRFLFQRLEIRAADGRPLGELWPQAAVVADQCPAAARRHGAANAAATCTGGPVCAAWQALLARTEA